jgi:hypothetical protein
MNYRSKIVHRLPNYSDRWRHFDRESGGLAGYCRRIVFLGVRLVSDNRRIFPRRYHCSDGHHHTIIGLSGDETSEFERLDQQLPLDHSGNVSCDFERGPKTEVEKRWLELYRKHETAWNEWLDPIKVAAAD